MKQRGFTLITGILLLIGVLIMGLVSLSLVHFSVDASQISSQFYSEIAAAADGCMEEGIVRLRRDSAFSAASLTLGNVSCTITSAFISGSDYRLTVISSNAPGDSLTIQATIRRTVAGQTTTLQILTYSRI